MTKSKEDKKSVEIVNNHVNEDTIYDKFTGELSSTLNNKSGTSGLLSRFLNAGLEGAALFVAYEGSLQLLDVNYDVRQVLIDRSKRIPFVPYLD